MVFLQILMVDTCVVMRTDPFLGLGIDKLEMLRLGSRDDLEARIARVDFSVSLWVDHIDFPSPNPDA